MLRAPAAPWAFFAATLALLGLLPIHAGLHLDTARDLLIARDCVAGVVCGSGPPSSFGKWMHGALWSHLLELRAVLGLPVAALEVAAWTTLALAAALIPVTARLLDRPAHVLTWALWLPLTLLTIDHPTLWNPTLWPLALGLIHVLLLQAVRTRGVGWFVAAGAAVAVAADLHVLSALMLPWLLATSVGCAARPLLAAPAALAAFVAVTMASSPGSAAANAAQAREHLVAMLAVGGVAVLAGVSARRRLPADAAARARVVAWTVCVGFGVLLPALVLAVGHKWSARYLSPIVVPVAIGLGATVTRPNLRLVAGVLAVAWYLGWWGIDRMSNHRFRLVDVPKVAAAVYAEGQPFAELHEHLRGPQSFALRATLAAFEPSGRRPAQDDRDVLVVRAARSEVPDPAPAGWKVVDFGDAVAVIIATAPAVLVAGLEVCGDKCVTVDRESVRFPTSRGRWTERAYADLPGLPQAGPNGRITYRFKLAATGKPRRVQLLHDDCEAWQLGNGATFADLAGDEAALEFTTSPRCRRWYPPFVELPADDPALANLLKRSAR